MRPRISTRGSVRPSIRISVCPSVGPSDCYAFSKTIACPLIEMLKAHRIAPRGLFSKYGKMNWLTWIISTQTIKCKVAHLVCLMQLLTVARWHDGLIASKTMHWEKEITHSLAPLAPQCSIPLRFVLLHCAPLRNLDTFLLIMQVEGHFNRHDIFSWVKIKLSIRKMECHS